MTVIPFSAFGDGAFRRVTQSQARVISPTQATYKIKQRHTGPVCSPNHKTVFGSVGLNLSTYLKTEGGWTAVEDIKAGTFVETFDDGWQRVQTIIRHRVESAIQSGSHQSRLVRIDPNVVGNTVDLYLPTAQPVLIESDLAENLFGDPFPVVMAQSLVEADMAEEVRIYGDVELFELRFARPQLVFCAGGAVTLTRSQSAQFDDLAIFGILGDRYRVLDEMTATALLRADRLAAEINAGGRK
jgi:hypothetical protein